MKILVSSHTYKGDGSSQMLLKAMEFWIRTLGWEIDVLVAPKTDSPEITNLERVGAKTLGMINLGEGYDLALINCLINAPLIEKFYPYLPTVIWAHEAETILPALKDLTVWRKYLQKSCLIIFQTEWQRTSVFKEILSDVAQVKTILIPNGIPPIDNHLGGLVKKHEGFRVVNSGAITPFKQQALLAKSILSLSHEFPIICDFYGDLTLSTALSSAEASLFNENPKTLITYGYLQREQMLKHMQGADIFCSPSIFESFGLSALEAASLGIPIILANIPVYELIGWKNNENCLLHEIGNEQDLKNKIRCLLLDRELNKKLRTNGKVLANKFTFKSFLQKITNALESTSK